MISVKDLIRKFKTGETEITVLKGLNFEIPTGQFLAITGRSGAGKSTTLYQLSLLDHPSDGTITIDTTTITDMHGKDRVAYRRDNFGFIFQDYALLPTLTALENVILPLLMQGISRSEAEKKAKDALIQVGLGTVMDHLPSQLSGGEQQRVSIARAIVHNPKILFADEPTANLDVESSDDVLEIFLELNQRQDLTIVMVTHEPEYAELADRQIILLDGQIVSDTPQKRRLPGEVHTHQ